MRYLRHLYYVSIILDRYFVRSVTIHYILQSKKDRNVFGLIRHVSCFHQERYDKMIKIVYVFFYKHIKIQGLGSDILKATQNIG